MQLASKSEEALSKVSDLLVKLGDEFSIFELYTSSVNLEPAHLERFFNTLVDLFLNVAAAIKHFRKHNIETVFTTAWSPVNDDFIKTLEKINSSLEYIQRLFTAQGVIDSHKYISSQSNPTQAQLAQTVGQLNMTGRSQGPTDPSEEPALPCNTLPFTRNKAFFGRAAILKELETSLLPTDDETKVRSVTLYGSGGIGKSQIALEYAHSEVRRGTPVVLWIGSETNAELSKSFTEAAKRLKLRDYSENNTPDQNKIDVLRYLQNTRMCRAVLTIFQSNAPSRDFLAAGV